MSFNPCFNGLSFLIMLSLFIRNVQKKCFNPCFNGLSFLIEIGLKEKSQIYLVSILVLMDYHFLLKSSKKFGMVYKSFNPCFNGLSFLIRQFLEIQYYRVLQKIFQNITLVIFWLFSTKNISIRTGFRNFFVRSNPHFKGIIEFQELYHKYTRMVHLKIDFDILYYIFL